MPPEYRFKGTARQLDGYPDHFSFLQGAPKLCSGPCQKTLSISFDKSSWTSWTHGLLREWDFGIFWLCSAKAWFSYPFTIFYLLTAETLLCAGIGHSDADSTSLPSPASSAANTPGMITAEVVWRFGEYLQTPTHTYTMCHNVSRTQWYSKNLKNTIKISQNSQALRPELP